MPGNLINDPNVRADLNRLNSKKIKLKTGQDLPLINQFIIMYDSLGNEVGRIGDNAKNNAQMWLEDFYVSESRDSQVFVRGHIASGIPTITFGSGGDSAVLRFSSANVLEINTGLTLTSINATQYQEDGINSTTVRSISAPTPSGFYVATSSGGSPTTQLNQVTVTFGDGSTQDFIIPN